MMALWTRKAQNYFLAFDLDFAFFFLHAVCVLYLVLSISKDNCVSYNVLKDVNIIMSVILGVKLCLVVRSQPTKVFEESASSIFRKEKQCSDVMTASSTETRRHFPQDRTLPIIMKICIINKGTYYVWVSLCFYLPFSLQSLLLLLLLLLSSSSSSSSSPITPYSHIT